jgi:ribose transport system permease protein
MPPRLRALGSRFLADYGILLVLLALCVFFSVATYTTQQPNGAAGGAQLGQVIASRTPAGAAVLVAARDNREDAEFVEALEAGLRESGRAVAAKVQGQPVDARAALEKLAGAGGKLDVIACSPAARTWAVWDQLPQRFPQLAGAKVLAPTAFRGSNFLKPDNLLNIANQIAVIAIVAMGMTLVIITGGIDLSVGSLIALSAVVTTLLIRDRAGAEQASAAGMVLASLCGVAACAGIGLFSGAMVTWLRIPAFIVTLGMMLVASGLAFLLAKGQSIYQVPDGFVQLGRGAALGVPLAVWLMIGVYVVAHFLMARTRQGRYVYAVGSNGEASRLSGVPVGWTLLSVYALSGALAGLGGVVMASQLKSGAPTYGQMYELYVIAAVVVGGASLSGGEGKAFGTLIGAFLIAVIQNGMNLTGVESYTQKVVLGLVILGAVMIDTLKRRNWRFGKLGVKA